MISDVEFLAAGGNRHSSAADWAPGLLAFGSNNNVAVWAPEASNQAGVRALLAGHTDAVHAIKFYDNGKARKIISGSADKTIRIWKANEQISNGFQQSACLKEHAGSINTLSVLPEASLFVSGSADGTLKIWRLVDNSPELVQSITLRPTFLPLATALVVLPGGDIVLALAGTVKDVQIYFRGRASKTFSLHATLSGHEGWVRSLDFARERPDDRSDILLASASQDKYVRIWRFHRTGEAAAEVMTGPTDERMPPVAAATFLSNKSHTVGEAEHAYAVTFEALLIGHEDWIYTVRWAPRRDGDNPPALLTASADNSLSIWNADAASGLWVCSTRLGDISAQKGSTTATGSIGGFWIGLWRPDGSSVASLGRTGSWRLWDFDVASHTWLQQVGITGHVEDVQAIAWSPDGTYLLSTSADQTTRLFSEWRRDGRASWHEFARPQIHGYALNCLATVTTNQFISGADEKLLRVFDKPKAIDTLLARLCGTMPTVGGDNAEAANIPVLGLSNKAVTVVDDDDGTTGAPRGGVDERDGAVPSCVIHKSTLNLDHPPFEDHLARHTLWPEHEKLYGHGYEISAVATSTDGSLVATACRASSIDHATVRIYETREWREIKPPLTAHSLTVTGLAFSPDDRYLLSVGRDRQWTLFSREDGSVAYERRLADPKGHSRMILGCSWAPLTVGHVFATAGRDKVVKVWKVQDGSVACVASISTAAPVTAVAFNLNPGFDLVSLAYAWEDGDIAIASLDPTSLLPSQTHNLAREILPSKNVNALRWRPRSDGDAARATAAASQLAAVSDDWSLRIYNVH